MHVAQGDYVILLVGERPTLARCSFAPPAGKKTYKAVICKEQDSAKKTVMPVEFTLNEVQANLGRSPTVGTAYGQKIEPLLKTRTSKLWEEIRIYQTLDEKEEAAMVREIADAYRKLASMKLVGIRIELEVRQEQGKYAGMYKFRPKLETDIMIVKPPQNLEGLHYIVFHEYAHGIWYRRMTAKRRFAWVQLYHNYVALQEVSETDLNDIREELEASESVSAFFKAADEQTQMIFKSILRQISQIHGLTKKHLDLAISQGESVEEYWPVALELSEKETIITEYARVSPEEFFAEAFAHHVAGRKIPKKIQAMLDETLTKLSTPVGAKVAAKRSGPEDGEKKTSKKTKRKSGLK